MKRKELYISVVVVAALVGGFLLWGAVERRAISLEKPPDIPVFLIGGLPPEQQAHVDAFKARILHRISSGKPLTEKEKKKVSAVLFTQAVSYKFSTEERASIEAVLK